MEYKKGFISVFLTVLILTLIILSGPANAITVTLSPIGDFNKGSSVSFTITVQIEDGELLPLQYINLIITGPNGFSKTCKINSDGTNDCNDVITLTSALDLTWTNGAAYGYDQNLGYGYDLGNGFGYTTNSPGFLTYSITWNTPTTLEDGSYSAKAEVFAQGSTASHTYSSSSSSFKVGTYSVLGGGGSSGGGASWSTEQPETQTPTNPTNPTIPEPEVNTPTTETTPAAPTGMSALTGAVTGALTSTPGILIISTIIILGIVGYVFYLKRKI